MTDSLSIAVHAFAIREFVFRGWWDTASYVDELVHLFQWSTI